MRLFLSVCKGNLTCASTDFDARTLCMTPIAFAAFVLHLATHTRFSILTHDVNRPVPAN